MLKNRELKIEDKYLKAREMLLKYNQKHLLLKYDKFTKEEKEELLDQILNIDFNNIDKLYKEAISKEKVVKDKIGPIEYIDKSKLKDEIKEKYFKLGQEILKQNQFAVITLAGGQGTRLGHIGPKGTYMLNLNSPKSLFQILCEKLKKASEKYKNNIFWYIMISKENHKQTIEFFENNKYFGYPKEKIIFFIQGQIPMISKEGKILLTEKGFVKQAADGHRRDI